MLRRSPHVDVHALCHGQPASDCHLPNAALPASTVLSTCKAMAVIEGAPDSPCTYNCQLVAPAHMPPHACVPVALGAAPQARLVLAGRSASGLTAADARALPFITAVINETLRLWPAGPILVRRATQARRHTQCMQGGGHLCLCILEHG